MRYDPGMRRSARLALVALALCGCRGTVPKLNGVPEGGIAAVLIGCRVTLPTGETSSGRVALNLEGEEGNGETYRLPLKPGRPLLYQVEPGVYRLAPTRSLFGFHQENLKVVIEGRSYSVPFPRDILRKAALDIKPTKVVAIGTLDIKLTRLQNRGTTVRVYLDDGAESRRALVQKEIRLMMDPNAAGSDRATALAWTRGLTEQLTQIVTEVQRGPAYRLGP
jgi:hypothetical protein